MNTKTLQEQTDEFERAVNHFGEACHIMTPKVCPKCHILKTDGNDLISIYHAGMCLKCDHVESDWSPEEKIDYEDKGVPSLLDK